MAASRDRGTSGPADNGTSGVEDNATSGPTDSVTSGPADRGTSGVTPRWAICCSGGGIRSASYCLGALQRLEKDNFLDRTAVIVGVSGGGYIAAARALVAHGLIEDKVKPGAGERPYEPGTAEEQHLRRNTRYVAPDAKTVLAGALSLLLGITVTLLLVLAPVFAVAHAWGWILRSTGTLAYAGSSARSGAPRWTASVSAPGWYIYPVLAGGLTVGIFLVFWVTLAPDSRGREGHSQKLARALGWAAFLTFALALAMLAVPELIAWLSTVPSLQAVLDDLGLGPGAAWTPAAAAGFVMAVVAVAQSAQMGLAKFTGLKAELDKLRSSGGPAGSTPAPGPLTMIGGYVREMLLPWLASALIVLAGFVAAVHWVKDGTIAGFGAGQAALVIGALAVMLAARVATDVNRISLHDIYRWRLASAYGVVRDGRPSGTRHAAGVLLSDLKDEDPELVLCTTANINAEREVPAGRGGVSFTFDPRHATIRGLGPSEPADTADYEVLVGKHRFTLFDVSAISGAAFSPLMGVATQQAQRILFTATGLRLGVWLPHPAIVAAAREEVRLQDRGADGHPADHWWHWLGLFLWYLLPHRWWGPEDKEHKSREARLWAYVLRLRGHDGDGPAFLGALLYRALQPTLGMLYAEAAGHTSYRSTWMCVTDGGHYENLGLVEALQRREDLGITHVLVLDASGDAANTFSTLGGAMALARSDAETSIELDPTSMIYPLEVGMTALAKGQVVRPWATGSITDPEGMPPESIVVCKLGWWKAAPWDVCAYAAGHASYPTESTLDQLYDVAEFDAYRQLGWSAVDAAIKAGKLPAQAPARQSRPAGNSV
jgi:hypothetical protein